MSLSTGICDVTTLLSGTPVSAIFSMDTEGAPIKLTQVSLVCTRRGECKQIYNTYSDSGVLSDGKKQNFIDTLNQAKVIVGYNLDSDLKALALQGITIPDNIVLIDLYHTFIYLKDHEHLTVEGLTGCALSDVATYYGVKEVKSFHNSLVDAKVTMDLFWRMVKKTHGMLWVVSPRVTKIAPNLKELYAKEVNKQMDMTDMPTMMDYSYEEPASLMKTNDGFYQGMVVIGRKERLVRLTKKEYKLLKKIRQLVPNYPLSVFYVSIVVPGAQETIRIYEESKEKEVPVDTEEETSQPEQELAVDDAAPIPF